MFVDYIIIQIKILIQVNVYNFKFKITFKKFQRPRWYYKIKIITNCKCIFNLL